MRRLRAGTLRNSGAEPVRLPSTTPATHPADSTTTGGTRRHMAGRNDGHAYVHRHNKALPTVRPPEVSYGWQGNGF
ncbi:MAG: hypothetical protein ACI3Y5_02565 [Prevotella sp.]